MAEKSTLLEKLARPAIVIPLAAAIIIAVAGFWYPPLFQPGYAPANDAPFFSRQTTGVDINTANLAELTALPGIGQARAQAIIDYREANGSFHSIEDILEVNGIGPGIFNKIKNLITV